MKNHLLSLWLVVSLLCSSLFSPYSAPSAQAATSPTPPTGWVLATTFQKVPLTLNSVTYYAYELKKSSANVAGGWLIAKADGTIVSDRATYQKLALTATVSKVVRDPAFLPQMKNELEVLKGIRWRIELYEAATGLTKLGTDIVAILKGKPAMGGLEDVAATLLTPTEITEGNRVHDILWPLFTGGLVNNLSPSITKALKLVGTVGDSSEQYLKVFGIVGTVLRKTVAAFAQGGATTYQKAFTLASTPRSSWSYEDASLFLKEYEEGRTHGLPFAKWYISLIPHEGGFFGSMENIGDMWWENIIKEVIPSVPGAVVDGMKLSEDLVKRCLNDTMFTNEINADIQSAASIFAIYRLTYDPSITGSLAEQIVTAVTPVATTTDKTMYAVGDLVAAKDVLRVREHASATATSKGAVPKGTTGTIIGSSVVADTYRWWPVRWSTGLTGWSAGAYLVRSVAKRAGETGTAYAWPALLFYSNSGTQFWRVGSGTEVLRSVFTLPSSISVKKSEVGSGDPMVYLDPTGGNVAIVGREDDRYAIYVLKSDGTGFRKVVPSTANDIYSCTWSPNGSQLAYATVVGEHDSAVWTVRLSGGQPTMLKTIAKGASSSLSDATFNVFTQLAWSLDGNSVVLGKGWGKSEKKVDDMYWCPVSSSAHQIPYGVRSPNGKRVAYRVLNGSGVRVCDSSTGGNDRLVFGKDGDANATPLFPTSVQWVAWLSDNRTLVAYVNNLTVVTIDVDSPKLDVRNIAGNGFSVTACAVSPGGAKIALVGSKSGGTDGLYVGRDPGRLSRYEKPQGYGQNGMERLVWSSDGGYLACPLYWTSGSVFDGPFGGRLLVFDLARGDFDTSLGGQPLDFLGWTK
ncbi:MAG: hypothetical protein NT102_00505 [Caldiserica bacterium]|nr:hypothetical protein [Caldisericota bacterium]